MKKLASLMVGMGLILGTCTFATAQEQKEAPTKVEKKKKTAKKKSSKKKTEEPKQQ